MRHLPARRLASTVLCASVLAGITGPVALAADAAGEHGRTASRASVPATEKERLLAQARALGRTHPELSPVTDLLSRSLEAGRLPADEARRLGEAAKEAVTRAAEARPAQPATAGQPATEEQPVTSAAPRVAARHAHAGAPMARDGLDDALGALVTAIENLVQAVTDQAATEAATDQAATAADSDQAATEAATDQTAVAADSDQLLPSFDDLLSGLLDLLTGLFGGGTKLAVTELPTPASVPAPAPAG
ncbi:hypothetical protein [Streptomyces achromogenes]|uniref:hypothetical protein n=1 Tax=Streptomyces achromogenes TaxID=67255 RepID=UPI0034359F2A